MGRLASFAIIFLLALGFLTLGPAGCDRDDAIVAYSAPKDSPAPVRPAMDAAFQPPAAPGDAPTWIVPAGWKPVAAGAMRFAAFSVSSSDPNLLVTVVPLPGGQALTENINRWQKQIGNAPLSDAEANALLKPAGRNAALRSVELIGKSDSILAAFAEHGGEQGGEHGGQTWFFKLQGPTNEVESQRESFAAFLDSVSFGAPVPATDSKTATTADQFTWTVPDGWQAQPPRPMCLAAFRTAADAQAAEVIVSQFPVGAFGGILPNVNRWRNMVGLAPLASESEIKPQHLLIGEQSIDVYDFTGESTGANPAPLRVRVASVPSADGRQVLFFRLQGAAEIVAAEQAAFDQFVQSLKFKS